VKRLTREQRMIVVDKNPYSYISAVEGQECNGYIKHKGKWVLMKPSTIKEKNNVK